MKEIAGSRKTKLNLLCYETDAFMFYVWVKVQVHLLVLYTGWVMFVYVFNVWDTVEYWSITIILVNVLRSTHRKEFSLIYFCVSNKNSSLAAFIIKYFLDYWHQAVNNRHSVATINVWNKLVFSGNNYKFHIYRFNIFLKIS